MLTLSFLLLTAILATTVAFSLRADARKFDNTTFELDSCSYTSTCNAGGIEGVCVSISAGCCAGGTVTSGLCSGSNDIKCCTSAKCSTPSGSGTCRPTSSPCSGNYYKGYCSGPSNIECCVASSPVKSPVSSPVAKPTPSTPSTLGFDLAVSLPTSDASCMASSGYGYVVVRAFHSSGTPDTNFCPAITNAQAGGIKWRDAYMFPCPTCSSSASSQFSSMMNTINSCKSVWSGRVWLDIENSSLWTGSTSSNKSFFQALVTACESYGGVQCGIYSSASQWQPIFGSTSYTYCSNLPLWYADYDNAKNFNDFKAFGGWSKPYAKQYAGDATVCKLDVDLNYAPSWSG